MSLAASDCVSPRAFSSFSILIISSERIARCSASAGPNPRSLKTFPLGRVPLLLAFSIALFPPMFQQLSVPSSSQLQVTTGGLACALLEGVQYVDPLEKPGDIADPVLCLGVDSYLPYASANASHWLPIVGFQTLLHAQ